jgi:hypothetical protein
MGGVAQVGSDQLAALRPVSLVFALVIGFSQV